SEPLGQRHLRQRPQAPARGGRDAVRWRRRAGGHDRAALQVTLAAAGVVHGRMSARRLAVCVVALVASGAARAAGPPRLVVGAVEYDADGSEVALLVGALRADGTPAKLADARLLLDGSEVATAAALEPLASYATDHPKWTPPLAIGVVYQWAAGSPQQVLDGIEALFKHLPARATVYPTPYGQGYRPVITKITAARAAGGDLAEVPPLEGDQLRLAGAVRFNLHKLGEDDAPLKHLVLVTDGRDAESGQPGAFAALGEELRHQHVQLS